MLLQSQSQSEAVCTSKPRQADRRSAHLRTACEASIKWLRLERIDVYRLHAVDPILPIAGSLGALLELQRDGKIRFNWRHKLQLGTSRDSATSGTHCLSSVPVQFCRP
ncbi:aldo/keto reductase [Bradyrhizobium sp. BEA-2-5]|uniref:aldo/keto reductase n=1 Tax=Bradyrhizobium sp. BEA-2-5 TaxID=3080015 RepID=UPI00397CCA36